MKICLLQISRPMCLDMIRMKLQPRSPQRYTHVAQFVNDCRLLFRNAYHYNPVTTPPDTAHRCTRYTDVIHMYRFDSHSANSFVSSEVDMKHNCPHFYPDLTIREYM